MKRWSKRVGISFLGSVVILSAAFFVAPDLLCVEQPFLTGGTADSMVVLGGVPIPRATHAAALYEKGLAKRILITGTGDCLKSEEILTRHHISKLQIHLECDSRTTKENAQFATRILHEQHARKVILVTSWYHSRRARACFRHFAPDIEFISMPSHENMSRWPRHWKADGQYVFNEYLKILGYVVRWGILPC